MRRTYGPAEKNLTRIQLTMTKLDWDCTKFAKGIFRTTNQKLDRTEPFSQTPLGSH